MASRAILKAANNFNNNGQWIVLAKELAGAKDRNEDLCNIGISKQVIDQLISAYCFLEVKEPFRLSDNETNNVDFKAISRLPFLKRFLTENLFDKYFNELMAGMINTEMVEEIWIKLSGDKIKCFSDQPESNLPNQGEIELLLKSFQGELYLMIAKYGYNNIRKGFSKICDDLATELRCISDEGYKKQCDKRRIGSL